MNAENNAKNIGSIRSERENMGGKRINTVIR